MRDLRGLEQLQVSTLLEDFPVGEPVELPLDAIELDPTQPRRHVDEDRLQELARTIREVGIVQPISVRPHKTIPGRYVVNVGERRVRACRIAGRSTIPAFVRATIDPYARVIENLEREELSPFDLATFIAEREAAGDRRTVIAERIGRSTTFLSEIMALADAPEPVRRIYESGRCRDVRTLGILARRSRTDPHMVVALSQGEEPISRSRALAEFAGTSRTTASASHSVRRRTRERTLLVECEGKAGILKLDAETSLSSAEIVFNDGRRETVALRRLRLLQWTSA